ncbi:MAG TPA: ABC transporter substrate-binding protein, partial [Gemmatimonadaceae bacterium]
MLRRLLFLASAAACLSCATEAAPIVIGSAGPWAEAYGLMNKRGIDLAVEEINAKGGIAGRPLQVLSRDDEGDGVKAAAIADLLRAEWDEEGARAAVRSAAALGLLPPDTDLFQLNLD